MLDGNPSTTNLATTVLATHPHPQHLADARCATQPGAERGGRKFQQSLDRTTVKII